MLYRVFMLWCIINGSLYVSAGIWRQENMLGSPHLVYYPEEEPTAEDKEYPAEDGIEYVVQDHQNGYQRLQKNVWDRNAWNPHAFKTIPDFQFFFHNKERNHVEGRGYRQPRTDNRHKRSTPALMQDVGDVMWTFYQKGGLTQENWRDVFAACGGRNQSPIVINQNRLRPLFVHDVKFGDGYFSHDGHNMDFYNNGHGLSIDMVDPDHGATLTEGPFNYTYSLATIQFFYRSLHNIEDDSYPMEILFIHKMQHVSMEEALKMPNGVLIMSVMVQGITSSPQINKEKRQAIQTLLSFTSHSSILGKPGARLRSLKIKASLISLIPLVPHQFYLYKGSLPYPPCTEGVIWMVNRPILYIPTDILQVVMYNLKQMRNALTLEVRKNNRLPQPVNNRHTFLLIVGVPPDPQFNEDGDLLYFRG